MILKFIEDIRRTSGNIAKAQMLKAMPEYTSEVLNYTLNPFNNYGVSTLVDLDIWNEGDERISQETFDLLDNLNNRKLTGNAARKALAQHAYRLNSDDAQVLGIILSGKPRLGLGIKSLNKYLTNKIPVHETKLANKFDVTTARFPLWASPKLDGLRGEARNGLMLSRTGKPILGQNHIIDQLNGEIPLDGELMIPGKPFEVSSGLLRSHAKNPDSIYYVFDTPIPGVIFEDRLEAIAKIKGKYKGIKILKHELVHNMQELYTYYNKCRALGLEGVVTKKVNHTFTSGRNNDWLKMKDVQTIDAPIVGYEEGEGKFEGTLGAVIIRLDNGQLNRVGTGYTDNLRDEIWCNKVEYMGKMAEYGYHELTIDGNLRHSRFFRWREDKDG